MKNLIYHIFTLFRTCVNGFALRYVISYYFLWTLLIPNQRRTQNISFYGSIFEPT